MSVLRRVMATEDGRRTLFDLPDAPRPDPLSPTGDEPVSTGFRSSIGGASLAMLSAQMPTLRMPIATIATKTPTPRRILFRFPPERLCLLRSRRVMRQKE